jgi:hypothetical protein
VAYAYDDRSEPMSQEEREDLLLRMLKAEEEESLGYAESELTGNQIEALKRYFGEKYGDEEEGRSQVTTREVLEAVEWQRNDYARVFSSGGNIVSVEETSEDQAKSAKDAADYLQWMFFSDNPGFENLDDFTFDGLLHRRGYLACYWSDKEYQAPQKLTGLNIMQVQELVNDPQVEIIGQDFSEESEAGGINLVIRRLKSPARAIIESVAPEDMRLNGRAVTIDGARYVGRVRRMLCGEAVRLWPDKRDEIIAACGKAGSVAGFSRRSEDVRATRFKDDANDWFSNGNEAGQEVEILEEYLRVDLNEDDYPETIRSYRIGDLLLEEGEVEENPFGSWTPIRIPHRFQGMSIHDITQDLQRQNTVIMRAGLDALYQAVVNREAYDRNKLGEDGAAALLSTVAGTKIPVDGDPNAAIVPLVGGVNTTQIAWEALNMNRQRLEDRTGATRQTRGLDTDQLAKEHSGKALGMLQLNADARKEMIARNLAAGLAAFMAKLYRLVCRNQNEARQAKVGGKFCQFDPRTWNSMLQVTVHAGGVNREHALTGLMMIGQEQEKVIELLGPANPLVTTRNRHRYQEELARLSGWKSAEPFFTEPPDQPVMDPQTGQPVMDEDGQPKTEPWKPEPQPDPQMAKVEADAKLREQKQQSDIIVQYEKLQSDNRQRMADMWLEMQKDAAKQEQAREAAWLKTQAAIEESNRRAAEGVQQMMLDFKLAVMEMRQDFVISKMEIDAKKEADRERSKSNGVDTDVNGR